MRFLRGLDAHKLEHNSADWRQRFHYKEWRQRSRDAPPNLLLGSQPFSSHPVTAAFWRATPEPDAIIFNSCAWDLPQVRFERMPDAAATGPNALLPACEAARDRPRHR